MGSSAFTLLAPKKVKHPDKDFALAFLGYATNAVAVILPLFIETLKA